MVDNTLLINLLSFVRV